MMIELITTPPTSTKRQQTNPFITAATPLLTMKTQIRHSTSHPNIPKLRNQIMTELHHFEQQLLQLSYQPRIVIAARYCLCTAIDETILSTAWGSQSIWIQSSLLSTFHQETWGGERFYIILDNLIKEPRQNIHIIELIYLLLSLGFEGKLYDKETIIRDDIRQRVFHHIRQSRGKVERALATHWTDPKPLQDNLQQSASLKTLLKTAAIALCGMIVIFNIQVYRLSSNTLSALNHISLESPITAYSQLIDRSIVPHRFE